METGSSKHELCHSEERSRSQMQSSCVPRIPTAHKRMESINRLLRPGVTFKSAGWQSLQLACNLLQDKAAEEEEEEGVYSSLGALEIQSQYIGMNFNESRLRPCSHSSDTDASYVPRPGIRYIVINTAAAAAQQPQQATQE